MFSLSTVIKHYYIQLSTITDYYYIDHIVFHLLRLKIVIHVAIRFIICYTFQLAPLKLLLAEHKAKSCKYLFVVMINSRPHIFVRWILIFQSWLINQSLSVRWIHSFCPKNQNKTKTNQKWPPRLHINTIYLWHVCLGKCMHCNQSFFPWHQFHRWVMSSWFKSCTMFHMKKYQIMLCICACQGSLAVVTWANLWHKSVIRIKMTAKIVFKIFSSRDHKPFVKWSLLSPRVYLPLTLFRDALWCCCVCWRLVHDMKTYIHQVKMMALQLWYLLINDCFEHLIGTMNACNTF